MKKMILIFIAIVCFSCDVNTAIEKPENIIDPQIMEDILFDLILMKAIRNSDYIKNEHKKYFANQYIFEKYGIDSIQIAQNQSYYTKNPKFLKKIYEKMQARTTRLKDSIDSLTQREYSLN